MTASTQRRNTTFSLKRYALTLSVLLTLGSAFSHGAQTTATTDEPQADIHHLVFVWLSDRSEATQAATIAATWALADIPGVSDFKVAKAMASERAIVDDSFSFGITMRFRSPASMNTYLQSPAHQQYLNTFIKGQTDKVVVYDF